MPPPPPPDSRDDRGPSRDYGRRSRSRSPPRRGPSSYRRSRSPPLRRHRVPLELRAGVGTNADKTQETVKAIIEQKWSNTTGGIPGNDDAGTMSAWFIWAALGFVLFLSPSPLPPPALPLPSNRFLRSFFKHFTSSSIHHHTHRNAAPGLVLLLHAFNMKLGVECGCMSSMCSCCYSF